MKYPSWICGDCGKEHGQRECGLATWHNGLCEVCFEEKAVTEPRDFGHLTKAAIRKLGITYIRTIKKYE